MSMKGFFNPKQTNQHLQTELADFKHQIKRINTLEVHMNRFLKLEPQMGSLIMFKKKLEAQPVLSNDSSSSQRDAHKNTELNLPKNSRTAWLPMLPAAPVMRTCRPLIARNPVLSISVEIDWFLFPQGRSSSVQKKDRRYRRLFGCGVQQQYYLAIR